MGIKGEGDKKMSSLQKYYVLYYKLLVTILYNYHTYVPSACECVIFG